MLDDQSLGQWARPSKENDASSELTERHLIARMASGDRSALRDLYWVYFPHLAQFFVHLTTTITSEVIERLINDTMLGVWRASGAFEPDTSAYVWIMSRAFVNARAHLNRGSDLRHRAALDPLHTKAGYTLSHTTQESASIRRAFASLRVVERAVVHFVYTGRSRQEIATILCVSCECVDEILARARLGMRTWSRRWAESQKLHAWNGASAP